MILGGKKSTTQKGEASSDAAAVALKLIIPKLFLNSFMTSSTTTPLIRQSGRNKLMSLY